jgi:hypothetical protein
VVPDVCVYHRVGCTPDILYKVPASKPLLDIKASIPILVVDI